VQNSENPFPKFGNPHFVKLFGAVNAQPGALSGCHSKPRFREVSTKVFTLEEGGKPNFTGYAIYGVHQPVTVSSLGIKVRKIQPAQGGPGRPRPDGNGLPSVI
jgi:hypothetical protein